jgi:hypothetical protein
MSVEDIEARLRASFKTKADNAVVATPPISAPVVQEDLTDGVGPNHSDYIEQSLRDSFKKPAQPDDNSQWMQERYPQADGLILDYLKSMQSQGADVRAINAVYKKQYPQGQINAQMPPLETSPVPERETGVIAGVGDWFSGKQRRTPQSEAVPDLTEAGAIGDMMSNLPEEEANKFAGLNFLSWNPNEIAQMAVSLNPELAIVENVDAEGNPFPMLVKESTGQAWEVDPAGTSMTGGIKALGSVAAFNPAALTTKTFGTQLAKEGLVQGAKKQIASKAAMGALTSGITQAGIETAQEMGGGDVDVSEIALAGAGGAISEVVGPLASKVKQVTGKALSKAKSLIKTARGVDDLKIDVPEVAPKTAEEIKKIQIEQAARGFETNDSGEVIGGIERQVSQALQAGDEQRLAKMIDADPEFFADKDALGLLESGIPTQSSVIPAVRQTGENLSKAQGSDLYSAMKAQQDELGEKANEIAQKYGAIDKGVADFDAFEQGQKEIDKLVEVEKDAYKNINDTVNSKYISEADIIKDAIKKEAIESNKPSNLAINNAIKFAETGGSYKELNKIIKDIDGEMSGGTLINKDKSLKKIKALLLSHKTLDEGQMVSLDTSKKAIYDALKKSSDGVGSLNKVEKKILMLDKKGASYSDIDALRKDVGESIGKIKDIFPTVGEGALKRVYALLTADQEKAAAKFGLGDQWDIAKSVSNNKFDLQDNAKVLFGKNLDKQNLTSQLSSSMKDIGTNDKRFKEIMQSLPSGSPKADKERYQLIATAMQDIFKGGTTKGEGFNIGQFTKWYEKLNSSQTYKDRLYSEMPKEFRKELDTLGRFTSKLDKAVKDGSNTGVNLASAEIANKLQNSTKKFLGKYLGQITRGWIESGETLSKSEANKMVADKANLVLNDPNFINLVKAAANQKTETVKRIEDKMMKTKAMSQFKQSLTPTQRTALANQGFVQWFNNEYGENEMTSGDKVGPMP